MVVHPWVSKISVMTPLFSHVLSVIPCSSSRCAPVGWGLTWNRSCWKYGCNWMHRQQYDMWACLKILKMVESELFTNLRIKRIQTTTFHRETDDEPVDRMGKPIFRQTQTFLKGCIILNAIICNPRWLWDSEVTPLRAWTEHALFFHRNNSSR